MNTENPAPLPYPFGWPTGKPSRTERKPKKKWRRKSKGLTKLTTREPPTRTSGNGRSWLSRGTPSSCRYCHQKQRGFPCCHCREFQLDFRRVYRARPISNDWRGNILAYAFGDRKDAVFQELKELLEPFCFSKLEKMHDIEIGLFVNRYEFCVLMS